MFDGEVFITKISSIYTPTSASIVVKKISSWNEMINNVIENTELKSRNNTLTQKQLYSDLCHSSLISF